MMAVILAALARLGEGVWRISLQAAVAVVLVTLLQGLLRRRLPARWIAAFWVLIILRLALPWLPQSPLSAYRWIAQERPRPAPFLTLEESGPGAVSLVANFQPFGAAPNLGNPPMAPAQSAGAQVRGSAPEARSSLPPETTTPLWRAWAGQHPFVAVWLAGMLILMVLLAIRTIRFARRIVRLRPTTEGCRLDLLEDCKASLGLHVPVALVQTAQIHSPMVLGFIRPRLLLPAGIFERLSEEQVRCVFLHELAHIRRHDILLGWLMALLLIVHWFNPLVWWASLRLRADREFACDAEALERLRTEDRKEYGRTLLGLLEEVPAAPLVPTMAGIVEHKVDLERRILMIKRFTQPLWLTSATGLALFILLGTCVLTAPAETSGRQVDRIDYPFVNDPAVVGTWTAVDFVAQPGDFTPGRKTWQGDLFVREMRIFPDGYWESTTANGPSPQKMFTWTQGLFISANDQTASHYEIRTLGGRQYLFREWKSGDYILRHQKPQYYVLVKGEGAAECDDAASLPVSGSGSRKAVMVSAPAKVSENASGRQVDKTDYPFVNDPDALGTWTAVDFVAQPGNFTPGRKTWAGDLFVRELHIRPNGYWDFMRSNGPSLQNRFTWTRGLLIMPDSQAASHYEIKALGGRQYLFMEWKTGDYTLGRQKPWLYVLVKASDKVPEVTPESRPMARTGSRNGTKYADSAMAGKPLPLGIHNHPGPLVFRRQIRELPAFNPDSDANWQVDLRSMDLSGVSVAGRLRDLMSADFDSKTRWPAVLPQGFEPGRIMEIGRNPGLGVRRLHEKGITGKGVGLAIIDQNLLVDHAEYKDRLRHYEEIHWPMGANTSSMHGPAVASIAVGRSVGVAPGADLYYIAEMHGEGSMNNFKWDFTWLARSIERVLEINRTLPADRKIRVISISVGWQPGQQGYQAVTAAVEQAKKDGVFVVSSSLKETFGMNFHGLGRAPLSDPEQSQAYEPGLWWQKQFFGSGGRALSGETLLVPMDSRCTASPTGAEDYVFYRQGGWSWSIPYIAGLYVLACQARPDVTPELFWKAALETGETTQVRGEGKSYPLGRIVQPERLIEKLAPAK